MANGGVGERVMVEAVNDNLEFCEEYLRQYVEGGVGKLIRDFDHIPRHVLLKAYFMVVAELYHCEG